MDKKGKSLIIFYNDGIKVIRRDIVVKDEDENFFYDTTGHFWNKSFIIRMEEKEKLSSNNQNDSRREE